MKRVGDKAGRALSEHCSPIPEPAKPRMTGPALDRAPAIQAAFIHREVTSLRIEPAERSPAALYSGAGSAALHRDLAHPWSDGPVRARKLGSQRVGVVVRGVDWRSRLLATGFGQRSGIHSVKAHRVEQPNDELLRLCIIPCHGSAMSPVFLIWAGNLKGVSPRAGPASWRPICGAPPGRMAGESGMQRRTLRSMKPCCVPGSMRRPFTASLTSIRPRLTSRHVRLPGSCGSGWKAIGE